MPHQIALSQPSQSGITLPIILLILPLVLSFSGCAATMYSPVSHHVPVPQETGELRLSAQLLAPENYAIQGSMSPLPYVFVHGSLQRDVPGDDTRHRFGDVGAGLYTTFVPDEFADIRMTLSGLGAWGRGTVSGTANNFFREILQATADIERTAIQLDSAIQIPTEDTSNGQFFIAGTMRISRVRLTDIRFYDTAPGEDQNGVFISPGMQLGYQFAGARIYGTAGIVMPLEDFRDQDLTYRPLYAGIGLSADLFHPLRH